MLTESSVYEATTQIDDVAVCPMRCAEDDLPCELLESQHNANSSVKSLTPTMLMNEAPIVAVAFSSLEGNQWSGGVSLLDVTTKERLCEYQLSTGVSCLTWCGQESDFLAAGCDNGEVLFVRVCIDVDYAFIPQTALSSSTSSCSSGGGDDANAGPGHDDVVTGVTTCHFDRTQVASCSWDTSVKLWNLETIGKCVYNFEEHEDLVWSVRTSPRAAHQFASSSQDGLVMVWDDRTASSNCVRLSTEYPALCVDWHPHQDHVLTTGLANGSLLTFDLRSPTTPLTKLDVHKGSIHTIKYSPFDSDLLLSASDDTTMCVVRTLLSPSSSSPSSATVDDPVLNSISIISGHSDYVRGLDWFQDVAKETFVVSGSWDKSFRLWHYQQE